MQDAVSLLLDSGGILMGLSFRSSLYDFPARFRPENAIICDLMRLYASVCDYMRFYAIICDCPSVMRFYAIIRDYMRLIGPYRKARCVLYRYGQAPTSTTLQLTRRWLDVHLALRG